MPYLGDTMAYRNFVDRDGRTWEIRDRTRANWTFHPVPGNMASPIDVPSPNYENDPFELSIEELQKMLDGAGGPVRSRPTKSPFAD